MAFGSVILIIVMMSSMPLSKRARIVGMALNRITHIGKHQGELSTAHFFTLTKAKKGGERIFEFTVVDHAFNNSGVVQVSALCCSCWILESMW